MEFLMEVLKVCLMDNWTELLMVLKMEFLLVTYLVVRMESDLG